MLRNCLLILYLVSISYLAAQNQDVDQIIRRIHAHFAIGDFASARLEAEDNLTLFPNSEALLAAYIRTLARTEDEKKMIKVWNQYAANFPENALNRDLIEEMAWGVLLKASKSPSLVIRQMTLLAALLSDDAKGVNILYRGMQDTNYAIRAVAVSLSGQLHDTKLIRQIKQLFKEETNWSVRQKIIEAIGSMQILEMRPHLEAIVASDYSLAEEKALAIKSLVELLDNIESNEVQRLVKSNRSGLRLLACKAIAHFQSLQDLDLLILLANDTQADVRIAALQSIGQLKPQQQSPIILNLARKGCLDQNYRVSITSAWLLTLYAPNEGMSQLAKHIKNEKREQRLFAVSALKATGHYGAPLILELYNTHPDPYVRLNLALGLAGQRLAISGVSHVLEEVLRNEDKWCKQEVGLFNAIVARHINKEGDLDAKPEMEDQLLRLEILNKLAILKSPYAQESIRRFLVERSWGITGSAVTLLLTEGDEFSINLVEGLLNDSQPKVRLQAALVLSLWSREETPIKVLEQSFFEADKEQKCRILEGLGRIGSMKSVPFLIKRMDEPSQTLRLIAAMALIQCLNN